MKRPAGLILLIALVGLLIGGGTGSYLGFNRAIRMIERLPASPIVLNAAYNGKHHSIVYSVYNPGTVPLKMVEGSFVFTPGKKSTQGEYILSHIPLNVTLKPASVTLVEMRLKEGTQKLHLGDVVVGTLSYTHPFSPDVYTVIHPFTYEGPKTPRKARNQKKGEGKK